MLGYGQWNMPTVSLCHETRYFSILPRDFWAPTARCFKISSGPGNEVMQCTFLRMKKRSILALLRSVRANQKDFHNKTPQRIAYPKILFILSFFNQAAVSRFIYSSTPYHVFSNRKLNYIIPTLTSFILFSAKSWLHKSIWNCKRFINLALKVQIEH